MNVMVVQLEEMLRLVDEIHKPPNIRDQMEENLFQAEIRRLYDRLIDHLSAFGLEGDYYGVSDYAVRPDLRDRPTTRAPPAPHIREFTITILTKKFFRCDYLRVLHNFLSGEASTYRIQIAQHFDLTWHLTLFLTAESAKIHCSSEAELSRLKAALAKL